MTALGNIVLLCVEVHELGREKLTAIFWAVVLSEEVKAKPSHTESPADIADVSCSPIELSELGIGPVVRRVTF